MRNELALALGLRTSPAQRDGMHDLHGDNARNRSA